MAITVGTRTLLTDLQYKYEQKILLPCNVSISIWCTSLLYLMSIVGKRHIGHVRVYTISDCVARTKQLEGLEVSVVAVQQSIHNPI